VVELAVSPTDRLTRLLRPLDPLPDELLPLLIRMAECAAIELGGAIDTGALRSRLVAELRAFGLRHEAIGDLFVLVGKGAAKAAEDRRKQPAALPSEGAMSGRRSPERRLAAALRLSQDAECQSAFRSRPGARK
jgi:hypothetical protein